MPELFASGRQKVIEYVVEKYGLERVCQVLAMGTMGTKSVLKDFGRALNVDHNEITKINKFVPSESGQQWPLSHCIFGDDEHDREPVKEMVEFAELHKKLFNIALDFQGMPRHTSIHAAAVVISPLPVDEVLPLSRGGDGEVVSQFDKDLVEELGLLKMDFLGLRTLGVMHRTIDLIKERHGVIIDPDKIPFEDPQVLKNISEGYTDGMFQIESGGFKDMFRKLNKVTFEDIIVALSLYRPGPMKFIPRYIACANGYSEPEYLFPGLKPILENTFGIIVYQEQVIKIATDLAGFTPGQADKFRKAVGKKDEELIKEQLDLLIYGDESKNIPGLVKNGVPVDKAIELGEQIKEFAKYAFNRSHSAAYAVLTVQTGFLKTHYPTEYMSSLISSYIGNSKSDEKIPYYIQEAKRMGIEILPPDINNSEYEFTLEGNSVRYGLGAIKGLNKAAISIAIERETNGQFKDIEDLAGRFSKRDLNKKAIEVLSLSGTLASITEETNREEILKDIYEARGYGYEDDVIDKYLDKSERSITKAKQMYSEYIMENLISDMLILQLEESLLGLYVSGHPLKKIADPIDWQLETVKGNRFDVIGIIKRTYVHTTKWGNKMAFITLETLEGDRDVLVFKNEYAANENKLEEGGIRVFTIEVQPNKNDPGEYSYIAKNIKYYRGEVKND